MSGTGVGRMIHEQFLSPSPYLLTAYTIPSLLVRIVGPKSQIMSAWTWINVAKNAHVERHECPTKDMPSSITLQ